MRGLIVRLHRWFGLGAAFFLLVAGTTGALLPWNHELDAWLNPQFFESPARGDVLDPLALAALVERAYPQVRVSYIPLAATPGQALSFGVEPRPGGEAPGFDEVFVDPVNGAVLGTRLWGQLYPLGRANLMPFLYVLHYSLHLPGTWGTWLMGGIAVLWVIDCFIGAYLTLPVRAGGQTAIAAEERGAASWWQRWAPAWRIRRVRGHRLHFDLHRAGGLWGWGLLLVLAFSSVALTLYAELFYPALAKITTITPSPYDVRSPGPQYRNREPGVSFAEVLTKARAEGVAQGWKLPPGDIFHARSYGFYRIKFFDAQHPAGEGPLGHNLLFYDDVDGSLVGAMDPGSGTLGDTIIDLQFPIHSGHILGFAGRVLVSLAGILLCALIITGLVIWRRRQVARALRRTRGSIHAHTGP